MSNKYDLILGEYRQADYSDLSGYFKLDQSQPQFVNNGIPTFSQGIYVNKLLSGAVFSSTGAITSNWFQNGNDPAAWYSDDSGALFLYYNPATDLYIISATHLGDETDSWIKPSGFSAIGDYIGQGIYTGQTITIGSATAWGISSQGYTTGLSGSIGQWTNDVPYADTTNVMSLYNKRKVPRLFTTSATDFLTPEIDTYDIFNLTSQDQNLSVANASTSTPEEGEIIEINITSNGSLYVITWDTQFNGFPTDIPATGTLKILGEWDSNAGVWNYLSTPSYWARTGNILTPTTATDWINRGAVTPLSPLTIGYDLSEATYGITLTNNAVTNSDIYFQFNSLGSYGAAGIDINLEGVTQFGWYAYLAGNRDSRNYWALQTWDGHGTPHNAIKINQDATLYLDAYTDGFLKVHHGDVTVDNSTYLTSLAGAVLTDQSTPQTIGLTGSRLTKLWATTVDTTNLTVGTLTGLLKGTSGVVSVATAGTDYQVPLWSRSGIILSTKTAGDQVAINNTTGGIPLSVTASTNYANPTTNTRNGVFSVANTTNAYGMIFGVDDSSGKAFISSQRFSGGAANYALCLNPLGVAGTSGHYVVIGSMTALTGGTTDGSLSLPIGGSSIFIKGGGTANTELTGTYLRVGQVTGAGSGYIQSDNSIGMSLRWNTSTSAGISFSSTDLIATSNLGFNLGYPSIRWASVYTATITANLTNVGLLDATSPFDVGTGRGLHVKSDKLATIMAQGYYKDGTSTSYNSQFVLFYSVNSQSRLFYNAGAALFQITNEYVGSDATHTYGNIQFGVMTGGGSSLVYPWSIRAYTGGLLAADGYNIEVGTTTGTKIGIATNQKLGFWNATPIVQPTLSAYTTDAESSAYTGIDNLQVGSVYAQLTDLNSLRVAYENLRAAYDDLRTKIKTTGILA